MSLLYWGVQDWTQHSRCALTNAKQRRVMSLDLMETLLLMQPHLLLVEAPTFPLADPFQPSSSCSSEGMGFIQPYSEKAEGELYCCLQLPDERVQRRWSQILPRDTR